MELTDDQIAYIKRDLILRGISMEDLADSLVDHICCALEENESLDFHLAYSQALAAFGEGEIAKIQTLTTQLIIYKNYLTMTRTMFILGYVAAMLSSTGVLFKLMHWPGASILLVLGVAMLNFGFLPLYFYDRYKRALN